MHRGNKTAIQAGWLLITISAAANQVRADYEFVALSAETYGSTGMCSADPLTNANEDALYFDNGFGSYVQREYQTNLTYDGRDLADQGHYAWGADESDPYGTDFADVIFLSGHAGSNCTAGSERVWMTPGDSSDGCTLYLAHKTSASRHTTLGGTTAGRDANALITYACQTTQYCAYTAGAHAGLSASDSQMNILNGFHGDVVEVSGYQGDLGSYSSASVNDHLGDAWIDWLYSTYSGGIENCPSSILWGANQAETDDFFTYAGWNELRNTGARTVTRYYKLCGCDPAAGPALPGC